MNTNHTPGPWTLNPAQSTRVDLIDNHKGEAIGEIVWVDVRNPADARLIAAAPALLHALRIIQANPNDPWSHRVALDAMTTATEVQS
jgi:hypothetical protein